MCRVTHISLLLLVYYAPVSANTIVVDVNGSGEFTEIQPAIDAAEDGDEILVKAGEYVITEPIDFNRLYDPDDPESPPIKNIVVRSDAGPDLTTIRMAGNPANPQRASVAVFENGESTASVLDGFTLTGGRGTLRNGGAILCRLSAPTLANCTITQNSAREGGGMYSYSCGPVVTGCVFKGNSAERGGGMLNGPAANTTVTSCRFIDNTAELFGGGARDCDSNATFTNCVFSGNVAEVGGGVGAFSSITTLTNCTFHSNWAYNGGAIDCSLESKVSVTNCILWGNRAMQGNEIAISDCSHGGVMVTVISSDVEGGAAGVYAHWNNCLPDWRSGNIDADPLFGQWGEAAEVYVDSSYPGYGDGSEKTPYSGLAAALGDYSLALSSDSPCLGTGEGGADMGADLGLCEAAGEAARLIHLARGTYSVRHLNLHHNVSIQGAGEEETVIEGPVRGLCTGAMLSHLTVTRGAPGIYITHGQAPEIEHCTITGNSGSGVICKRSSPILSNCTISGNVASQGGGVNLARSSPRLSHCTISGNTAGDGGGLFCSRSSPALTNCTISGNSVSEEGGGVSCYSSSSPTLTKCTISGNVADHGGGIFCEGESSPILAGCILWDNVGGPISASVDSTPEVSHSCIETGEVWPGAGNINEGPLFCGWQDGATVYVDSSHEPPGEGTESDPYSTLASALESYSLALWEKSPCIGTGPEGENMGAETGVCLEEPVNRGLLRLAAGNYDIRGLNLTRNVSIEGAGRESTTIEGTVLGLRTGSVFSHVTVTGGTAGGIRVSGAQSPEIIACTISENRSGEKGGGGLACSQNSAPTLRNCVIARNATELNQPGGGVWCEDASPTLENCVISGNWSGHYGGGLWCDRSSPVLLNCIISGNSGRSGGALCCIWECAPALTNCTITGNRFGASIYVDFDSSVPEIKNCVIWGNGDGTIWYDSHSRVLTTYYSCVETSKALGQGSILADPLFVEPGVWDDSGTPDDFRDDVWTDGDYRLQPGSPCIDSGHVADGLNTDIDGNERPCGAGVDMGAYEFQTEDCLSEVVPFRRADPNADEKRDISDAVLTLLYLFSGGEAPTCLKAADSDDTGTVDVTDAVYLLNYLFLGGPRPKEPFPDCGLDPTVDELGCESFVCEVVASDDV